MPSRPQDPTGIEGGLRGVVPTAAAGCPPSSTCVQVRASAYAGVLVSTTMSRSESMRAASRAHDPTTTTPRTSSCSSARRLTVSTIDRTHRALLGQHGEILAGLIDAPSCRPGGHRAQRGCGDRSPDTRRPRRSRLTRRRRCRAKQRCLAGRGWVGIHIAAQRSAVVRCDGPAR